MSSSTFGDGREQRDVEVPADDRCEREDSIGVRSEASEAPADNLLDADGQPHRPQIDVGHPPTLVVLEDGAGLSEVAQDLPYEERVPRRLRQHRVTQQPRPSSGISWPAISSSSTSRSTSRQAPEGNPFHAALPVELGQQLCHRMIDTDLGVAEGAQHSRSHRRLGGHDVTEQLHRGPVRPVQVVEHHQHRLLAGQAFEQIRDAAEQHEPLAVAITREQEGPTDTRLANSGTRRAS